MKLRLMTWNVHRCVGVDKRLDVERCARVIAAARPDIVGLQELDVGRRRTGGVDQAHRLAQLVEMTHRFNAAMHIEEERYGDALMTHLPERLVRAGPLPGYPKIRALEPRGAVWIAVELPDGRELQVINTHLGLVPQEQKKQAAALVEDWMADEAFTAPAVLMGDFNATPFNAPYRILSAAMKDAQLMWPGAPMSTYPSAFPFMRIDHVFVSRGVKVLRIESPFDPESRKASDHLPLIVEIEIPAPAAPPAPA
ncbi:MAG TPA: endonuclease/exonuclease/phosphatase family protein [Caulobacter sp.]|nr:endonuclease/exonuclease/phosphatase family protein [Caulobacter sp.]